MKRIHATFDGHVLQPEDASALEQNKRYILTVEDAPADKAPAGKHPFDTILEIAHDLGIPDLAERHDDYARKR